MSIKKLSVRIRTKGKTRGRPSKAEITMSKLMSWQLEKNKPEIMKAHTDMLMLGTGCLKMFNNGNMKHVNPKTPKKLSKRR